MNYRLALTALAALPHLAQAATFTVLHAFAGGATDGNAPNSLAVQGATLYGTTEAGGSTQCANGNVVGCGIVFAVDLKTGAEKTVLALDPAGNFPSTVTPGGASLLVDSGFGGTAGNLISIAINKPKERVFYGFPGGQSGGGSGAFGPLLPRAGVVIGTTAFGGTFGACPHNGNGGCGTIYGVNPKAGTQTFQYSFGKPANGENPFGVISGGGSLVYGTTFWGGAASTGCAAFGNLGCGLLYAFDTATQKQTVLHRFTGGATDGGNPGPVLLLAGTLYGITASTLYSYHIATKTFTLLHGFAGGADGSQPSALTTDGHALYGTTLFGGPTGHGTIWKFDPASGQETVLYSFGDPKKDGQQPNALVWAAGALYGTMQFAGPKIAGTAYRFTP